MKKIAMGIFVLGAAATLVACGGGGGGAPAVSTPAVETKPLSKFTNYEGVWKEGCALDPFLRVDNIDGASVYRTRTRTVQMTSPLAAAVISTTFAYVDQIRIFDNNLCAGEPKLKITSPGNFQIYGGQNTTIDGLPAERASITVYVGTAEGYTGILGSGPFVLNTIYFIGPTTADWTYLSQAVMAKTVFQIDGAKWYFVASPQNGDMYPTTLLKTYYLTKS